MPHRRLLPAFPHPHFMAFAPLDIWLRTLLRGRAILRISPRYWLRLVWCLFTSTLGTILTLPERLIWALFPIPEGGDRTETDTAPPASALTPATPQVVCILGYFRSGTTHLHYILSCDPANTTPRWYHCLAPQGWLFSWAFLRWFLVPFLASTRPQDDMAIGPEWPAEDDFALCNGHMASSMPGRMVLPREWTTGGRWSVMHNLDHATTTDRARFRRGVAAFARRITALPGQRGKRLILKNPSHTGRIDELIRAFGAPNIRFIHIARDPAAVLRSNISMHGRFDPFLLQPLPNPEELRARLITEYSQTERAFLAQAARLPPGMLTRIRYQDLIADPLAQLQRAYRELGLAWSDDLATRFTDYLRTVADYRTATQQQTKSAGASRPAAKAPDPLPAELAWMLDAFDHHTPTTPKAALPPAPVAAPSSAPTNPPPLSPTLAILCTACTWAALWLGLSFILSDRMDWFTWPTGVVLGLIALHAATARGRAGSPRLGLAAAAATLLTFLIIAYPATALSFYRGRTPTPWADIWDSTRDGLLAINNLFWIFLGVVTAYRLASRKHAAAPGMTPLSPKATTLR